MTSTTDICTRFLFSETDIRGEWVHLGEAYQSLLGNGNYSASVAMLLGEFAAAVVLISNTLKYRGRITLQARGNGPLSLLMVDCTSERMIRGIARGDVQNQSEHPMDLLKDGQLVLTIQREGSKQYQGIVALGSDCLAHVLNGYFLQSEQLNTHFILAADGATAAGIMLQQLPPHVAQSSETRQNHWETATLLAATLSQDELLSLPLDQLIHRLYHEYDREVFQPQPIRFYCGCNRQRSLRSLALLPAAELELALEESDPLVVTCEMCDATYQFSRSDLASEGLGVLAEPRILH